MGRRDGRNVFGGWRGGGALPMHVVPKVLSMRSGGIESVEVEWVSWIVSGESAWISIIIT